MYMWKNKMVVVRPVILLICLIFIQNVSGISITTSEIEKQYGPLEMVISKLQMMEEKIKLLQENDQKMKSKMEIMERKLKLKDTQLLQQQTEHDKNLKDLEHKLFSRFNKYEQRLHSLETEKAMLRRMYMDQNVRIKKLETNSSNLWSFHASQKHGHYSDGESELYRDRTEKVKKDISKRLLQPAATPSQEVSLPTIAFHAYFSKSEGHLTDHHTLIFDIVRTNAGNGYNKHSGSFIVPRSGIYVFTWTLVSYTGEICTNIIINGIEEGNSYSHPSSNYETSTSIIVVHVNQGDTVLIRTISYTGCNQAGSILSDKWRRSSFSGWLLG